MIAACHANGILVYAWLELPHVSEKFWDEHPQWREKTALLQDAQLDWRKLMNLHQSRLPSRLRPRALSELMRRFDWDGVNLAELYFESLEGAANPSRFTPMNDDVRAQLQAASRHSIPSNYFRREKTPLAQRRHFLDFRAGLARHMQAGMARRNRSSARKAKPQHLDLVLTHVDDQLDKAMRDAIGADSPPASCPLLEHHNFTFLIEDPATVWNLGPQRYGRSPNNTSRSQNTAGRLAIDMNIVDRYQNVYPTKQQTGTELFQLVHSASAAFPRVALYFENSILPPDWQLLGAAAANVGKFESHGASLTIASPEGVGLAWPDPALVDGRPWPVRDAALVWLTPGEHVISPSSQDIALELRDFNGTLRTAAVVPGGLTFSYESNSRALATLSAHPKHVEVDGEVFDSSSGLFCCSTRPAHRDRDASRSRKLTSAPRAWPTDRNSEFRTAWDRT